MDLLTTIYETAYHAIKHDSALIDLQETVVRNRSVYVIFCYSILLDLRAKTNDYPDLISDDYTFCQTTGKTAQSSGQPGLLTKSARDPKGDNAVIFKPEILSNPRLETHLSYHYDPKTKKFSAVDLNEVEVLSL
jgi:hypothetical protein